MSTMSPEVCAEQIGFAGHETFVLRYAWLKKAVDAIATDSSIFNTEQAMVELGVGKNMVRSIRFWALACGVLEEVPRTRGVELRVSSFGEMLFGKRGLDPFLEDIASLWLLHWKICSSQKRATTWCWTFNNYSSVQFSREDLAGFLNSELRRRTFSPPSSDTLKRDVDCFLRTYVPSRRVKQTILEDSLDSPLAEVGLIWGDTESGIFRFVRGTKSTLADAILLFALLEFWQKRAPHRDTLAFSEVAYSFGSPGVIFKLDEESLTSFLERLETITRGCLVYGETAGLKQVYRRTLMDEFHVLNGHYSALSGPVRVGAKK